MVRQTAGKNANVAFFLLSIFVGFGHFS